MEHVSFVMQPVQIHAPDVKKALASMGQSVKDVLMHVHNAILMQQKKFVSLALKPLQLTIKLNSVFNAQNIV